MGYEIYNQARDSTLAQGRAQMAQMEEMNAKRTRRQAGNALAGGDYGGAANALLQGGDIQGGMAVQGAQRSIQTADREQAKAAVLSVVTGLRAIPAEQRAQQLQAIAPRLAAFGITSEQMATIRPEDLSDQGLDSLIGMMGGQPRGNAPSGYRYKADGTLEAIPGGPEAAENQRWQVTPYGLIPPAGWQPPAGQQQAPRSLGSTVPEGWSTEPPRPNQPPSAPAAGGGERSQTPRVSFRSSGEARQTVTQMVPGVRVTNADRTPADTARIRAQGYKPSDTSFHLQGRALDLVPPSGMSMGELEAKMRQAGFRVLNEGHHVHVSW